MISDIPVQFAAVEVSTGGSALPPTPDVMSISPGLAEPSITESARQQAHTCSAVSGPIVNNVNRYGLAVEASRASAGGVIIQQI